MEKQKKIILSILIITTILSTQVVLPLQVSAGNQPLDYDNPNKNGDNPYKVSFKGVINSGVLVQVVSCTGVVNKIAKVTTEFIHSLTLSKEERAALKNKATADKQNKVPSSDPTGSGEILKANQKADENERLTKFEKCIDGIAIQLAKNQLTSMTKYTMNWINSGFNGDPMYVQNVNSFMSSIEDEILQREVNLFKDPNSQVDYPYGRDFARSEIGINQSAKNFANSMKQDLTRYLVPGATPDSFANDFSQGGWDGWLALTQHPQNNPLGFNMLESQHLSDKQAKEVQNTKDELQQGGGYLSQKKCVEYEKTDKGGTGAGDSGGTKATTTTPKCLKYQTVTPSSTIKAKIDTYVNSPERQLELVKTMNDALNALFTALLSKFENQGLSSLSSGGNWTTPVSGGFGINNIVDSDGNVISSTVTSTTGGTGGDGFFNITIDLGNTYTIAPNGTLTIANRGVLQLQHDYVNKIGDSKIVLDKILPAVGKLDYCIPGPNPDWRNIADASINTYVDDVNNGATPVIPLNTLDDQLNDYGTTTDITYGADSPMQDPATGNTAYLKMSPDGLSITKDIVSYVDTTATANNDYATALGYSNTDIAKLNIIKDKVNVIIAAAQARRATKRAAAGLPAFKAICLSTEKVTWLDNGVLK